MQEQQRQQQLIRDGDVEDEQPMQQDDDDGGMEPQRQFRDDGKSKLVQEAKAMMQQDDDDEKPAGDENAGPKIKMGRIGKKKRTNAKDADKAKQGGAAADIGAAKPGAMIEDDSRGAEGFTE